MNVSLKSAFAVLLATISFGSARADQARSDAYTLTADCDTQAADTTLQKYLGQQATIESALAAVNDAYNDAASAYESAGNAARGYSDLGNGYSVKVSYGTDGGPVSTDFFVLSAQGSSYAGKKIQAAIKSCVVYPN